MEERIFIHDRKFFMIDPRIKFCVGLIGSFCMIFIENEIALIVAFILSVLYCIYCGKWKNALWFVAIFSLLFYWTCSMMNSDTPSSGFIIASLMLRRLMVIGAFATPLISTQMSLLTAALHKMKMPRFIIISMAILFRFIPTFSEEYRAVRTSQKFRGIARFILGALLHPIIFYETLIVPLAIRIMRISDELSAAAILRGADRKGNGTCFRELKITISDYFVFAIIILIISACMLINYNLLFVEVTL